MRSTVHEYAVLAGGWPTGASSSPRAASAASAAHAPLGSVVRPVDWRTATRWPGGRCTGSAT